MNRTLSIVLGSIVVLALIAGAFYGGTLYGKGQAEAAQAQARERIFSGSDTAAFPGAGLAGTPQPGMRGGFFGGGAAGGGAFGQVEEINGDTLVVTGADGQRTTVKVTDTTLIEKYASVTVADMQPGETVIVSGSSNADGSITARSVQVAPAGRLGQDASGN